MKIKLPTDFDEATLRGINFQMNGSYQIPKKEVVHAWFDLRKREAAYHGNQFLAKKSARVQNAFDKALKEEGEE